MGADALGLSADQGKSGSLLDDGTNILECTIGRFASGHGADMADHLACPLYLREGLRDHRVLLLWHRNAAPAPPITCTLDVVPDCSLRPFDLMRDGRRQLSQYAHA